MSQLPHAVTRTVAALYLSFVQSQDVKCRAGMYGTNFYVFYLGGWYVLADIKRKHPCRRVGRFFLVIAGSSLPVIFWSLYCCCVYRGQYSNDATWQEKDNGWRNVKNKGWCQ